jgi:hypothetical protein
MSIIGICVKHTGIKIIAIGACVYNVKSEEHIDTFKVAINTKIMNNGDECPDDFCMNHWNIFWTKQSAKLLKNYVSKKENCVNEKNAIEMFHNWYNKHRYELMQNNEHVYTLSEQPSFYLGQINNEFKKYGLNELHFLPDTNFYSKQLCYDTLTLHLRKSKYKKTHLPWIDANAMTMDAIKNINNMNRKNDIN